jgi:hypothetical protein
MDLWQLKQTRAFMERGENCKYCMYTLGLKNVLDYIGVPYSNTDKEIAQ